MLCSPVKSRYYSEYYRKNDSNESNEKMSAVENGKQKIASNIMNSPVLKLPYNVFGILKTFPL